MAAEGANTPRMADTEVAKTSDIAHYCELLGMDVDLMTRVMVAFGGDLKTPAATLTAIPQELIVPALTNVTGDKLSLVQIGTVMKFIKDVTAQQSPPDSAAVSAQAEQAKSPPTAPLATNKPKVSDAVDQMDDTVFEEPSDAEMQTYRANYVAVTGGRPPLKYTPTSKQLGGLLAKLNGNKPPYADFALFNCHGQRMAKITKFTAQVWVNNRLETKHLHGPGNFEAWMDCWHLFKVTMISLLAASPQRLDDYANGVRELNTLYPNSWGLVFAADELMRSEQWQLIRDELLDAKSWPESRPWDDVLLKATFGKGDVERQHWWNTHVVYPASSTGGGLKAVQAIEGSPYVPTPDGLFTNAGSTHVGSGKGAASRNEAESHRANRRPRNGKARDVPYQVNYYDHPKGKHKGTGKGKGHKSGKNKDNKGKAKGEKGSKNSSNN